MEPIKNDTPEAAIIDIKEAIAAKDGERFKARVELSQLINAAYDEATEEFAANCDKFHELYPHDMFFQFGAANIRSYNEKFRDVHIGFLEKFIDAYFGGKAKMPKNFEADPVAFAAFAFKKIHRLMRSSIKDVTAEGDTAIVGVEITGGIIYKKLIGTLDFKFALKKDESGLWRVCGVANVAELTPPVLDIAETYWPKSWDLGINF